MEEITDGLETETTLHTSNETVFAQRAISTIVQGSEFRGSTITPKPKHAQQVFFRVCGSTDHILSEKKCKPTLESIKTNLVDSLNCDSNQEYEIAE